MPLSHNVKEAVLIINMMFYIIGVMLFFINVDLICYL